LDLALVIGLILGFGSLLGAFIIEGGNPVQLANISATMIVVGGTIGATLIAHPMDLVISLPKLIIKALTGKPPDGAQVISTLVEFAQKARKEGLLSLEKDVDALSDPFLKKGLMLVVDGIEPETVREILENDLEAMGKRHERGYAMLEAMGGYAPTMGIIGTVMGLVSVLSHLSSPEELGPAIAVAFIATFYGVSTANILWLPLGGKLKLKSKAEIFVRQAMIEGVMAIQAGDNPRIVEEKLQAFLHTKAVKKGQQAQVAAEDLATKPA
jgi:chemotaxis protein MotA